MQTYACQCSVARSRRIQTGTTNPCDQGILGQTGVRVFDLDKGELDSPLAKILNQGFQLAITSRLDLEHALLVAAVLESVGEGSLDGEQNPLAIGGGAAGRG